MNPPRRRFPKNAPDSFCLKLVCRSGCPSYVNVAVWSFSQLSFNVVGVAAAWPDTLTVAPDGTERKPTSCVVPWMTLAHPVVAAANTISSSPNGRASFGMDILSKTGPTDGAAQTQDRTETREGRERPYGLIGSEAQWPLVPRRAPFASDACGFLAAGFRPAAVSQRPNQEPNREGLTVTP
jgi:hypothetical protein